MVEQNECCRITQKPGVAHFFASWFSARLVAFTWRNVSKHVVSSKTHHRASRSMKPR